jgi:hypothetical protein
LLWEPDRLEKGDGETAFQFRFANEHVSLLLPNAI